MEDIMSDEGSFSSMLTYGDREKLRHIVRKTHLRYYPTDKLTNYECDKFIDAMGAEVAGKMVKAAVDGGFIS